MLVFLNRRIFKTRWARLVLAAPMKHPEKISAAQLQTATEHLLPQLRDIIIESCHIIRRTRNEDTRQSRIDLCRRHLARMEEIKPFADKKQRAVIRECESAFSAVEGLE